MDNDINNFGGKSFITWTRESLEKEKAMADPEYICLSCGMTYIEDDWWSCHKCNTALCPKCGGEIVTIQEYDKAMRVNAKES